MMLIAKCIGFFLVLSCCTRIGAICGLTVFIETCMYQFARAEGMKEIKKTLSRMTDATSSGSFRLITTALHFISLSVFLDHKTY